MCACNLHHGGPGPCTCSCASHAKYRRADKPSGREWKPGDVALIEAGCWANRKVALRLDEGWSHVNGVNVDGDGVVSPVRPLVVIDPEDRERVERLVRSFYAEATADADTNAMQAALRSLITPPKPEEPTTWGVVEASCCHDDTRRKWVRHEDDNWWPAEKYGDVVARAVKGRDPRLSDCWDDLIDPQVIREGVQPC